MDETSPKGATTSRSGMARATSPVGGLRLISLAFALGLVASSCAQSETSSPVTAGPAETAPETDFEAAEPGSDSPDIPAGDQSIEIVWQESDLSGESFFDDLMATEDGYRVYRFAHGPRAWTSQDGVSWTPHELHLVTSSEEIAVYSVVRGSPGFLARGTDSPTPHPDPDDDGEMLWVSQDGFTWEKQEIELETPTLGVFAEVGAEELISSPDGLLMVGRMDRGPGGPDEHSFVLWASDDGVVWDLIEDPFPAGAYVEVHPAPRGFIAHGFVEGSEGPFELWSSPDGYSWMNVDTEFLNTRPPPSASPRPAEPQFTIWDDRLLAGATTDEGIRLWSSSDTQAWEPLPISGALDHTAEITATMHHLSAGPAGIVILGGIEKRLREPERSPLEIEKEGRRLIFDPETELLRISDLETGEVVLEVLDASLWEQVISQDEESISFVDPETGETLLSFGMEEWFTALEEAGWLAEPPDPGTFTSVLWFSPDGRRWTTFALEETFGIAEPPGNVVVGDNAVILHWDGWSLQGEYEEEFGDPGDEFEEAELEEAEFEEDPPGVMWVGVIDE